VRKQLTIKINQFKLLSEINIQHFRQFRDQLGVVGGKNARMIARFVAKSRARQIQLDMTTAARRLRLVELTVDDHRR
jgi:hypothetical protein